MGGALGFVLVGWIRLLLLLLGWPVSDPSAWLGPSLSVQHP
ncbi:MAG: hypothetical protein QXW41_02055 [Fervidicoccaceae archaeon]